MEIAITPLTYFIVCPLVMLAGFIDAIGGGGGLISLPAYLFAGIPPHMAIATNKLSSSCGTALATARFIKEKLVDLKLAAPTIITAFIGASIGARLSLITSESILKLVMIPLLSTAAFFVLNKKLFPEDTDQAAVIDSKTCITASIGSFVIGLYDGFYGPGTGTFLIIVLHVFAKLNVTNANAQAKVINLTTNFTSLVIFIINGQVFWSLGLACAACNMIGNYFGSSLTLKAGSKVVRPIILLVIGMLFIKILFNL